MTECIVCGRPVADNAYLDAHCAERARRDLATIADMATAARDVAQGMARRGPGGPSGSETRLPINLGATQRLDAVQNALSGWCRHIAAERGVPLPELIGAVHA